MKKYIIFMMVAVFLLVGFSFDNVSATGPYNEVSNYKFTQTLRYGMTNNAEVTELQKFLIAQGYLQGTPNGSIYDTTRSAIKKFQSAKGLTADGVVGAKTRAILNTLVNDGISVDEGVIDRSFLQNLFNSTFPQYCEGGRCAKQETGYTKISGSQYYIWAIDNTFDDSSSSGFRSALVDCSVETSCFVSFRFQDTWSCQQGRGHQNYSRELCI